MEAYPGLSLVAGCPFVPPASNVTPISFSVLAAAHSPHPPGPTISPIWLLLSASDGRTTRESLKLKYRASAQFYPGSDGTRFCDSDALFLVLRDCITWTSSVGSPSISHLHPIRVSIQQMVVPCRCPRCQFINWSVVVHDIARRATQQSADMSVQQGRLCRHLP
ncbi:hypothetical protein BDY19DRAFT_392465 [Irpex rosettiformis]|uniref:Uncharacterized protein n=1 Tax=Irpex rosettiformis TaxID=378272 RepID=A0ACB8TUN9_9APHY|nr:hypothetical protein BDY19DRAFT_392465 [Irpex rosettiformis]